MAKRTKLYNDLVDLDIKINESWGGVPNTTISKQCAAGLNSRRRNKFSEKEALDRTHANMIIGFGTLIAGALLMRNKPVLGLSLVTGGSALLAVTKNDWHVGKRVLLLIKSKYYK